MTPEQRELLSGLLKAIARIERKSQPLLADPTLLDSEAGQDALDVIRCSDWIIDLGPEGGDKGGEIVVTGTPEKVAQHPDSHTGRYLKQVLEQHPPEPVAA